MSRLNNNIKSPLRYPGGRSKMINILKDYFPKDFNFYMEPFVGGGSVFAYVKQNYPKTKVLWINDAYSNLMFMYMSLKNDKAKLIRTIQNIRNNFKNEGEKLFKYCIKHVESLYDCNMVGACFFILNRITFSGLSLSGGYSKQAFEKRFTDSSIKRLEEFATLLESGNGQSVLMSVGDYSNLIDNANGETFVYCDPPYYSAEKSKLYGNKGDKHIGFNHEEFANKMKNCNAKWMITYDDCEYIRNLYDFAYIYPVEYTYSMKNVGKEIKQKGNKEIIITNYDVKS